MKRFVVYLLIVSHACSARLISVKHLEQGLYLGSLATAAGLALHSAYHWAQHGSLPTLSVAAGILCATYGTYKAVTRTTPDTVLEALQRAHLRYDALNEFQATTDVTKAVQDGRITRTWKQWFKTRHLPLYTTTTPLHLAALVMRDDIKSLVYLENYCQDEGLIEAYSHLFALRTKIERMHLQITAEQNPDYERERKLITEYLESHYFKRLMPFIL